MEYSVYKSDLLEFLATPGITSKDREEINVEGVKAYTNQTLKEKLKADIRKHLPGYSTAILEKLIDSNELIPVFTTKGLWDRFIKFVYANLELLGSHHTCVL